MSILTIKRLEDGTPTDYFGRPFVAGGKVRVTAVGYGAAEWMGQGEWTIVKVGPKRCIITSPMCSTEKAVHMACLTVVQ